MKWIANVKYQLGLISILVWIANVNTLKHEYTIDDQIVITQNKLTQEGISAIPEIFSHAYMYGYNLREDESYRPLTLTTFAMERSFFDANESVSHFIQLLLYFLCVIALFKWLQRFLGEKYPYLPFVVTLLFALHPIHTEVVANIKSRDEILAALFLFTSWNLYLRIGESKKFLLFSLLFFFAACLSKDSAVMGILIYPFLDRLKFQYAFKQILVNGLWMTIPVLLYFVIRSIVLQDVLIKDPIDPVANAIAAASTSSEAWSMKFDIFSQYLRLTVFPFDLSWDYSISQIPISGWDTAGSFIGLFGFVALLFLIIYGWWKSSVFGFGAALFLGMFILTSNFFFLINCTLGERFLFLPVLGILLMVYLLVHYLTQKSKVFIGSILTVFVGFGFMSYTMVRNQDWKDNLSIYKAGVKRCPNSVKTHFNLGTAYIVEADKTSDVMAKSQLFFAAKEEMEASERCYANYPLIYENYGYIIGELAKLEDSTKRFSILNEGLRKMKIAQKKYHFKDEKFNQNFHYLRTTILGYDTVLERRNQLAKELLAENLKVKNASKADIQNRMYYYFILNEQDNLTKAMAEMVEKFPDQYAIALDLSKKYFESKQYDKSLSALELYLKYQPNDVSALNNKKMLQEILKLN